MATEAAREILLEYWAVIGRGISHYSVSQEAARPEGKARGRIIF